MAIQHIIRTKIDVAKWDRCISKSFNGIVYAYSWYLDIVSPSWEALVEGDYERVMPLTISEKYNVPYISQPYFTQQLGVFSTTKLNSQIVETFIDCVPDKYRYLEINLNSFNKLQNTEIIARENNNYELDLIQPYDKTYQEFSSNTKRNITKAKNNNLIIRKGLLPNEIVNFKINNLNEEENLKDIHFDTLRKIISFTTNYKFGESYGVYSDDHNLIATAFFVMSHYKTIFLLASSNEEGKEKAGMFLLVDNFIKNYSERNLTLDFEGSNLDGVARFYAGFGAKLCKYYSIKLNKLPWYMKLLKQ